MLIGLVWILSSCDYDNYLKKGLYNDRETLKNYNVIVIDSCEYLQWRSAYGYFMITHKGNCKNPIHNKK